MIISKTPFRISLIGGGTDFPNYYKKLPGLVIGGTINKYCYVTARYLPKVFNYKHRIVWSKNEVVNKNNQIIHPTVKAVFNYLKIKKGLEIHYQGDLQKNSGLGTSSSFCVGLINAIKNLDKKNVNKIGLAKTAIEIEQNIQKDPKEDVSTITFLHSATNETIFERLDKSTHEELEDLFEDIHWQRGALDRRARCTMTGGAV